MTRVSSGTKKSGPPAHPNKFAFTHNRNSRLTKTILALPINGLCSGCRDIIEWRKRYRKYKPLTVPKRCVRCEERSVKEAYHVICKSCAISSLSCAKCLQSLAKDEEATGTGVEEEEVESTREILDNIALDLAANVGPGEDDDETKVSGAHDGHELSTDDECPSDTVEQ